MISLYALAVFFVVIVLLCVVWRALGDKFFGEPWTYIGWAFIAAFALLWLLRILFSVGPMPGIIQ